MQTFRYKDQSYEHLLKKLCSALKIFASIIKVFLTSYDPCYIADKRCKKQIETEILSTKFGS